MTHGQEGCHSWSVLDLKQLAPAFAAEVQLWSPCPYGTPYQPRSGRQQMCTTCMFSHDGSPTLAVQAWLSLSQDVISHIAVVTAAGWLAAWGLVESNE